MKENMQNTVNEALKGIIETASQIKQFSLEQIPDVLNQLLMFKLAEAIAVIVFCIITIAISYVLFKRVEDEIDNYGDWNPQKGITAIIGGIFSFVSLIMIIASTFDILKITLAPKLYLIEYAAHLIK